MWISPPTHLFPKSGRSAAAPDFAVVDGDPPMRQAMHV
jgi:hypothetical protein